MKVYVVLESTRDNDYGYCGVYATLQQAENRIKEIQANCAKELNLYVQEENISK